MGFWGSALYSNDCTTDVRDDYKKHLEDGLNNEQAFREIMNAYADHMETDEEPLVWYALADTQWNLGRLMPEVKEKAIWWIKHDGGMTFWEGSANHGSGWRKTLAKLAEKLNTPQPVEKRIKKPAEFTKNPWNIGDVYAYRFHTEEAIEKGYAGKYMLMQKQGDKYYLGDTYSVIRVFDKIYDEIPTEVKLEELRLLPFALPHTYMPSGRNPVAPKLAICALMLFYKKRHYPNKQLTYLCSAPVPEKLYNRVTWGFEYSWNGLDHTLLFYHELWKNYTYELLENESVVTEIAQGEDPRSLD